MQFSLDLKEIEQCNIWLKEHDKTCIYKNGENQGAIGGRITYTFTPTGLGIVTRVKCACGEECDLTDYRSW